jgi:hypothetical protein
VVSSPGSHHSSRCELQSTQHEDATRKIESSQALILTPCTVYLSNQPAVIDKALWRAGTESRAWSQIASTAQTRSLACCLLPELAAWCAAPVGAMRATMHLGHTRAHAFAPARLANEAPCSLPVLPGRAGVCRMHLHKCKVTAGNRERTAKVLMLTSRSPPVATITTFAGGRG